MTISMIDIKRSILKSLKEKYPNHSLYFEQVQQDFKRPSFYIYFVPLESQQNSKSFVEKNLMVKIDYYSDNPSTEGNWMICEELEDIFHEVLQVGDRYLNITRTSNEIVEGTLVFTFVLRYENGAIEVINLPNDDGDIVQEEVNEHLDYTEEKIQFMRELELDKEMN